MKTHAEAATVYRGNECCYCHGAKPPNSTFDLPCYNRLPAVLRDALCDGNANKRLSAMIRAYDTLRFKDLALQQAQRRFAHGSRTH